MHFNTSQSRSAWTEQEDELLRQAVAKFGDRAWATVANDVPGRSSKSCSDRWRNFLSPDIEHPRKSPFTEWEVSVVVLAQARYGNNWKAISMLLPGRTNRAVKNLFVGNLKWGARLPEIRNRFLEWGMTLEELLEIKPDHAGGPVKLRPGQQLPAGSGSPTGSSLRAASTSSAGSAWQSDMTDQPLNTNGSPGSANTTDRRKRADGELAAAAGGQSPPLSKRRRGAQSPVLGAHHMQHGGALSPSLTPHPGALGPGFSGLPGSPTLGLTLPGAMGPPSSRPHLPAMMAANNTGALMMHRHCFGSGSNASSDGMGLLLPPGSHAPSELLLTGDSSPALTPGSALSAGLMGGCFTQAGAGAMPLMQQPGGPRSSSMPEGSLQQLLLSGDDAVASTGMTGRVASWHHAGQQVVSPAGSNCLNTTGAMGSTCASPFHQHQQDISMAAGASSGQISAGVTGLLTGHTDSDRAATAAAAAVKAEPTSADTFLAHQQQQQQHHHHHHNPWLQQHQAGHFAAAGPEQQLQTASGVAAMQSAKPTADCTSQPRAPCGSTAAAAAALGANMGLALPLPGSPVLTGHILTDMRSNDSAGLQQMLDQIFDDDEILADTQLTKLLGSPDTLAAHQHQQRSLAFADPPVVALPNAHEPAAPPPAAVAAADQQASQALSGQPGHLANANQAPMQQQQQQQQQQGAPATGADPAAAAAASGNSSLMHGSAWPSGWHGMHAASACAMHTGAGMPAGLPIHPAAGCMSADMAGAAAAAPTAAAAAAAATPGSTGGLGGMGAATCAGQQLTGQQQASGQHQHHTSGLSLPFRPGSSSGAGPTLSGPPSSGPPGPSEAVSGQPGRHHWGSSGGTGLPLPSPRSASESAPDMQMLCAQLQQENLLLMHKVYNLESRLGVGGQQQQQQQAQVPSGMAAEQGRSAATSAAAPAPAAAPAAPATPAPAPAPDSLEHKMSQLPPVLTRAGGSTSTHSGSAADTRGPSPAGAFSPVEPADHDMEDIVKHEAHMQDSPDGSFTPGQLINTAFLNDDDTLLSVL